MVTISRATSKTSLKVFERLPELIHQADPYFVPPFPGSIVKIFGADFPLIRHGGELVPLIAYRDGIPVGRIAAVYNPLHNEYYSDKTGFFGFFDFIDDEEVSGALVKAAEQALRERGLERMRGPYNPTVNDECGVLTNGFEASAMILMPYNPAYYLRHYENLGLQKARDLFAFYMSSSAPIPEKVVRVVDRVRAKANLSFRNIDMKRLDQELYIIQDLYNCMLTKNWGFIPISYEDLQFAAEDLKAMVKPSNILIAEKDGQPIGFSMLLPNLNELLRQVKSSKGLMRILKFVWLLKTKRPKESRLAIMGVKPEYQNMGIPAVFYMEAILRARNVIVGGELSWIDEENVPMIRSLEMMGATHYKTYRIYEKAV